MSMAVPHPTSLASRWSRLPGTVAALGLLAVVAALAWWAVVFGIVVNAGALSLREAGLCLVESSGLCQAIATLCTQDHPLGIRVYSPALLLVGTGMAGGGLLGIGLLALRDRCR